jgi:hypothetical protein
MAKSKSGGRTFGGNRGGGNSGIGLGKIFL